MEENSYIKKLTKTIIVNNKVSVILIVMSSKCKKYERIKKRLETLLSKLN